jgi:hypothetical protein
MHGSMNGKNETAKCLSTNKPTMTIDSDKNSQRIAVGIAAFHNRTSFNKISTDI